MYPCTGDPTAASSLNYLTGQVVPNGAIVALADDGAVCVHTKAESHLLVDVAGYVAAAATGIGTTAPTRVFDSRDTSPLVAGGMIELKVAGLAGIPLDASGVLLNVAVVTPDVPGYVTLWPCGERPRTSNLNYASGVLRANNAVTKLSPAGTVCLFSLAAADVVVDLTGWVD